MRKFAKDLALTAAALIMTMCGCRNGMQNISTTSKTDIATTVFPLSTSVTADTVPAAASSESAAPDMPDKEPDPIVETAEALIGVPFLYGGTTPSGFDNSGFIYYVLRENGYISCPRTISGQILWASSASYDELSEGDIAYFSKEEGGEAEIGGVYTGGGYMIFAPSPGKTVTRADITTDYWKSRFVAAITL